MRRKNETESIYIGIVSNEPIRAEGLACTFEGHADFVPLCSEAADLLADPRVLCMILDIPDAVEQTEMLQHMKRTRPDIRPIVIGTPGNDEATLRAITAGARGCLEATVGPFAVRKAVETVLQGFIWAPRRQLSMLIDRLLSQQAAVADDLILSPREQQVLDHIMMARSNREIALELGIEERTVKAYVASLLRKTGTENRVALSVRATQVSLRELRNQPPTETVDSAGASRSRSIELR